MAKTAAETQKLLFLCTRNSCRSQMAEGFARARDLPGFVIRSAGTESSAVHPLAIKVMAEVGIDISGQRSKSLDQLDSLDVDIVITLCDQAAATCPVLPGHPQRINWNLSDPAAVDGSEEEKVRAFRKSRDEIGRLIEDFFDRGYVQAMLDARHCEGVILDNISDGIMVHDKNRRIFVFNSAAESITGYRRKEVLNHDCHEVFSGGLCGGKCVFPDDGAPRPVETAEDVEISTKDGERRYVHVRRKWMTNGNARRGAVLVSFHDLTRERELTRRMGEVEQFSGIVGRDEKMLEVYDLIRDLADTDVPVLIQGESGTGKELVAQAIHKEGRRAGKSFVAVNCGALPESLLESELFGHVRGAFTGAIRDKKGRFELADGGTIFLDEIGDVAPAVQVKLLRVLQEGHFERVGSEETIQVDVRVISATNKKLSEEIEAGRFREDLYYRLSVVPIALPPLRERRMDIPLLVGHILKRLLAKEKKKGVTISPEAMDTMMSYDWPGNVREVENWIQFALVKCRGKSIRPEHLPPSATRLGGSSGASKRRRKLTEESVREALRRTEGSKVEAARLLNISRATLYRFLDAHPGLK